MTDDAKDEQVTDDEVRYVLEPATRFDVARLANRQNRINVAVMMALDDLSKGREVDGERFAEISEAFSEMSRMIDVLLGEQADG